MPRPRSTAYAGISKKSLIWRGGIDITDPAKIEKTIEEYVKLVILALEEQDLIFTKQEDKITGF